MKQGMAQQSSPHTGDRSAPSVRLLVLGSLQIWRGAQSVTLNHAKAHALLGYLACTELPPTREQMMALLWPESSSNAVRKNLSNTLWTLRTALGAVLAPATPRLQLDSSVEVDIHSFVRLTQRGLVLTHEDATGVAAIPNLKAALALYRGDLLNGLVIADAPDWELWLTGERERLRLLRSRVQHALITAYQYTEQWHDIIETAQHGLTHDPLDEGLYRAVMESYAQLGQRSQALHFYDVLQHVLERELGTGPLPPTRELRDTILAGALPRPTLGHRDNLLHATSRQRAAPTPLIGRRVPWEALDSALATVTRGEAQVVVLVGELGIGKSWLWQAWSTSIAETCAIVELRGLEATQGLPLAPYITWFNRSREAQRLLVPTGPLAPVWLAEVARLMPDLRTRVANLPLPIIVAADEERQRVFEALVQCLLALTPQPLVCFLDDAQWADYTTLDWLAYAFERLQEHPFLLVIAHRSEEVSPRLNGLLARWARDGVARRLLLGRFAVDESAALVKALGGDPAAVSFLYRQSQGNPYFLSELVQATEQALPTALTNVVQARLEQFQPEAYQVLEAVAVLELDVTVRTLRWVSGRNEDETLEALDTLLRANILREHNDEYTWVHPLVGAVVIERISAARRTLLHGRAATVLEALHLDHMPVVAIRLVKHYQQAGNPLRAATYADLAAEHALVMADGNAAVELYLQALQLDPTPLRRLGYGRALLLLQQLVAARAAFDAAQHEFNAQGDWQGAANAAMHLSLTYD